MNHVDHEHDERSIFEAMRRQIASTPMPQSLRFSLATLTQRVGRRRRRVVLGLVAGLAGIVVALVLILGGPAAAPAFGVTFNSSGTLVTITLNDLQDIGSLNAELAQMGVNIRAVPVVVGCDAPVQIVGSTAPPATLEDHPPGPGGGGILVSITLKTDIPAGQTVVLAASNAGVAVAQSVEGPAPSCVGLSPVALP